LSKKKPFKKDPYAKREASKYDNPIPSREFILDVLEKAPGPMGNRALCEALNLADEDHIEALRRRLIAMERDGQIMSNRKGAYGRVDKMQLVRGRVQGHREGFGFVIPADGSGDIYLTNRQMRKVFDGDEVLVRPGPADHRGRMEGSIVEVLSHNTEQLVGRFVAERGIYFVRPDNPRVGQDIMVAAEDIKGATAGQIVVVDITVQPGRQRHPVGVISEVLGNHLAPGMEIDVAIRSHGVPHIWPNEVLQDVAPLKAEVEDDDKAFRVDLRKVPFVTIDGEDARDFDDAVYCEPKRGGGWRLSVAIADVSHYVQPGSALDLEAQQRGNSVYFPDFVVPMLPEALSNGLCSLNPKVDRLCMVCEMTVSASGRITGYEFYEAVMYSHARFTYTQVGQIIEEQGDKNSGIRKQHTALLPQIDELHKLYKALRAAREVRGAIDFETRETRILFDADRKIERIVPTQRNDAHKVIEECMLAANVCAAKFIEFHELPGLYRIHEPPKDEKLGRLYEFLGELGLGMKGSGDVTPKDYQQVMSSIKGRPDENIIQTVMLRSMNQAVYSPQNLGHFGLAYQAYAHFTSPIRRYPDLLVHRALRRVIRSRIKTDKVRRVPKAKVIKVEDIYPYTDADMAAFGEMCSVTERRADDATRDVVSWLKCEYLKDRVGEEFDGVVSSVTGFGLFVELKDVYVEGLIHITGLPQDYYTFHAAQHRLVGERRKLVFGLSDELRVQVVRVDLDERKIDFELTEVKSSRKNKKLNMAEDRKAAGVEQGRGRKSANNKPAGKGPRSPRKRKVAATDGGDKMAATSKRDQAKAGAKGLTAKATAKAKPAGKAKPTAKAKAAAKSKPVSKAKTASSKAKPAAKAKPASKAKVGSKAQPKVATKAKSAKVTTSKTTKTAGAAVKSRRKKTSGKE
jgi:RNAse R (EC 3.1.-.-)